MFNLNFKIMKTNLLAILVLLIVPFTLVNAQRVAADNLIHSWTFEDGTAADEVGSADGTVEGSATIADGAVTIDSYDDAISLPAEVIAINQYPALSVSCWFKSLPTPDSVINDACHMVWFFGDSEYATPGDNTTDGPFGSNSLMLSPARCSGGAYTAITTGATDAPWGAENGVANGWDFQSGDSLYHMVTTINDTEIGLYLNGALVGTAELTDASGNGVNNMSNVSNNYAWIGKGGYAADNPYLGVVHDLQVYDKVLSDAEVLDIFNQGEDYVGINIVKSDFNPEVYAVDGAIHITKLNGAQISSVKLYNLVGNTVYENYDFNGVIEHNLPTSVYIMSIESNQGEFRTKLFIK